MSDLFGNDRQERRRVEQVRDITVLDLVDWCTAKGVHAKDATVAAAHIVWHSNETDEEMAARQEHARHVAERTQQWEREAYTRLRAKALAEGWDT